MEVMEACTGKSAAAALLVLDMNRFKNCVLVSRLVAAVNILNISYLATIRETLEQSAAVMKMVIARSQELWCFRVGTVA